MEDRHSKHTEGFVPLHTAARIVYTAVYYRRTYDVPTPERLAGMAHVIIGIVPVYTIPKDHAQPRHLATGELSGGIVRLGGIELHFVDGRPSITALFVSRKGIDHAIKLLQPPQERMPLTELSARQPRQEQ
jgi:CRISPR-associated Cas5-like protein